MTDWFAEFWAVFVHSTKAQLAVALGLISFFVLLILGQSLAAGIELHGALATLTELVRDKLMHRSDKAAWLALGSFMLLAFKAYRKDRRRLLGC